jgi:hypothetical protein
VVVGVVPPAGGVGPPAGALGVAGTAAVPTTGLAGGLAPSEPWKGMLEKAKIPPSDATIR